MNCIGFNIWIYSHIFVLTCLLVYTTQVATADICPEGYSPYTVKNDQQKFKLWISPNNTNLAEKHFKEVLDGTGLTHILKGTDGIVLELNVSRSFFVVKKVYVDTMEVRNVYIEFMEPKSLSSERVTTFATEKILKPIKSVFTTAETVTIPEEGLPVTRIRINFRTTKGKGKFELPEEQMFWVRKLKIETCIPTIDN